MPDLASLPSGTPVFVDTNIFYLHFTGRSATASAFIKRIAVGELSAYVNTQVLSDLLHKLMLAEAFAKGLIGKCRAAQLKKALQGNRMIAQSLVDCQSQFEDVLNLGIRVLRISRKLLVDTKDERQNQGLMTGDSIHLGNMNRHANRIRDIVTHDGDFAHVPDVTVWMPMDVASPSPAVLVAPAKASKAKPAAMRAKTMKKGW